MEFNTIGVLTVVGKALTHVPGGARTNFKVGRGHRSGVKRRKKNFLVVPLHFSAVKAQLVVFVSAFVMVSTVWPVSCLLFFYPVPIHL